MNLFHREIWTIYLWQTGELQSWADPKPTMQIVHKQDPFDGTMKPYGTFPAQISGLQDTDKTRKSSDSETLLPEHVTSDEGSLGDSKADDDLGLDYSKASVVEG